MSDYDFHQLSSHDFEEMSRDLLQAEWGVKLESFKTGPDGGTDLRYAQAGANTDADNIDDLRLVRRLKLAGLDGLLAERGAMSS
jgi:hypothetical protein